MSTSNLPTDSSHQLSLIKEYSIYGIHESDVISMKPVNMQENTIIASSNMTQILKHAAKLVFPSGNQVRYYNGKEAYEKCLEIVNISA